MVDPDLFADTGVLMMSSCTGSGSRLVVLMVDSTLARNLVCWFDTVAKQKLVHLIGPMLSLCVQVALLCIWNC